MPGCTVAPCNAFWAALFALLDTHLGELIEPQQISLLRLRDHVLGPGISTQEGLEMRQFVLSITS